MALTDGLIGYWKLAENAGNTTVVDSTGIQANATASQNTNLMTSTGKIGDCFSFNGTTDFVSIPHKADQLLTNGFTLSAWINPTGTGESGSGRIFDKSTATSSANGFALFHNATNRLGFAVNAGTTVRPANDCLSIGTNTWHHVLVTVTADALVTFYINGVISGVPGTTGALAGITTTNALYLGNRSGASDRTFNGKIDEAAAWNRVLSETEIQQVYNHFVGLSYDNFATPPNLPAMNISDSFKYLNRLSINIGDSFKDVKSISINIGDAFKTVY